MDIVENIAGIKLKRNYNLSAPKGVNGRNSDNTLIKQHFNWAPEIKLRDGLEKTYAWIYNGIVSGAQTKEGLAAGDQVGGEFAGGKRRFPARMIRCLPRGGGHWRNLFLAAAGFTLQR